MVSGPSVVGKCLVETQEGGVSLSVMTHPTADLGVRYRIIEALVAETREAVPCGLAYEDEKHGVLLLLKGWRVPATLAKSSVDNLDDADLPKSYLQNPPKLQWAAGEPSTWTAPPGSLARFSPWEVLRAASERGGGAAAAVTSPAGASAPARRSAMSRRTNAPQFHAKVSTGFGSLNPDALKAEDPKAVEDLDKALSRAAQKRRKVKKEKNRRAAPEG